MALANEDSLKLVVELKPLVLPVPEGIVYSHELAEKIGPVIVDALSRANLEITEKWLELMKGPEHRIHLVKGNKAYDKGPSKDKRGRRSKKRVKKAGGRLGKS